MFTLPSELLLLSWKRRKFGIAIAARIPMLATTIMSSMRVKPFLDSRMRLLIVMSILWILKHSSDRVPAPCRLWLRSLRVPVQESAASAGAFQEQHPCHRIASGSGARIHALTGRQIGIHPLRKTRLWRATNRDRADRSG